MTLEVQMMFHVGLLAVSLVCGVLVTNKEKDALEHLGESFFVSLFFFVPLELVYWVGGWVIGYFFF